MLRLRDTRSFFRVGSMQHAPSQQHMKKSVSHGFNFCFMGQKLREKPKSKTRGIRPWDNEAKLIQIKCEKFLPMAEKSVLSCHHLKLDFERGDSYF